MTSVLFVRHADVHNPKEIIYGRLPRFGLSDAGRAKAELTAEYLARKPVSAIYTSPLLRARQTAEIVARRHPEAPIYTSSLLTEVKTGWQGASAERYKERDFSFYRPLKEPDDETIEMVFHRMARGLHTIVRRHHGQTLVCVTHADPIMILKTGIAGRDLTIMGIKGPDYPAPASVTRFDYAVPLAGPRITYFDPARAAELKKPERRTIVGRSGRHLTLRPAAPQDAEGVIAGLERVAQEKVYLPIRRVMIAAERLAAEYARPGDMSVVAVGAAAIVGALRIQRRSRPDEAHRAELTMWLLPEFREDGFGRAMIAYAEDWARARKIEKLELAVFPENQRALHLFERLGYQREGLLARASRYEEDGSTSYRDALLLAKCLSIE